MTAVIHHGPPGSYKTFAIVQRVLIPALQAGRVVVTNIRGFNSIDRIRKILAIDIPDSAQILYLEPNDEGYATLARFFHWAPAGALIAMDEGQRVYPLRTKGFSHLDQPSDIVIHDQHGQTLVDVETGGLVCRPSTLENAIDQHRHFNWDIYISTPNIAKIHGEIRKAVEWGYRHRDNSGLLPWYKNTWSEFRHDSEASGKSVSHYSGVPKKYKADFRYFDCYQSTATGTAKLSNENISIFRDPKLRFMAVVIVVSLAFVIVNGIDAYDRVNQRIESPEGETVPVDTGGHRQVVNAVSDNVIGRVAAKGLPAGVPAVNPFEDSKIYFTGTINSAMFFEIELPDKTTVPIDQFELQSFGYRFVQRFGSFVTFDLNGRTVFAVPKPRQPMDERVATMERSAIPLVSGIP